ncbi:MAG: hypothetical protein BWY52_03272 [Chloroflexi bacterium ADurb.Bin325]|nr:MAG: hypothetical protein BWY52_03272 [Chloroflexi bacterium ADurb.Bin325]
MRACDIAGSGLNHITASSRVVSSASLPATRPAPPEVSCLSLSVAGTTSPLSMGRAEYRYCPATANGSVSASGASPARTRVRLASARLHWPCSEMSVGAFRPTWTSPFAARPFMRSHVLPFQR